MTEISAVTPPTPEPPKKPEHKHTREQVVQAFNETFEDFKFARQPLTPQDELIVSQIQSAKEKTIDKGKSRVQIKFSNEQTGEEFVTLEGVPIDRLLGYLKTRIESGLLTPEEMTTYKERWDILNAHKRPFLQGKQLNPSVRLARNQQEAALMSQTVADISGEVGFWNMAEVELSGRFELVLPPKTKAEDVTPPPPPEPPTEVLPPETTTPPPLPPEPPVEPPVDPPTETPPPQPPTVDNVRYEVAIVNRTADISKRAREVAEELLREKLKGRNIFRRIKYRVAEEYYRQKFTQQAYRAMLEHGNSYLSMESVGSSLRVLNADAGRTNERDAGDANIESIRTRLRERMGTQGIRIAEGPLRQQLIESIIQPVINGTITEPQQIQRALAEFIRAHSGDPVISQLFGSDSNAWGQASEYFATDLLDVGRAIQADFNAHGQSMEWLDQHLDIQLASPQWAASTENQKLSRTDRFIKWAQKRRLTGAIFNPAVVGAMSSIGTFAILRAPMRVASTAANLAAPGAGALSGGLFAAFRRNYDLKVDRNAHQVERAYGMQIPAGSKQRERLERFSYDTASVTDLINGGGVDRQRNNDPRRSVAELVGSDLTVEANQQDLVSRMAEIEARLEYSAINKVDLITFQSRETVEQGRLELLRVLVDGRAALRNAGVDQSRIDVMRASLAHHFESNQADRDREFKRFRLRSSLANGAFGSVAGMASGLVVQEGVALGMRATGHGVGQTFLEKAVGYDGSAPRTSSSPVDTFRDLAGRGGSYDTTSELRFNVDPTNHIVHITDLTNGRLVTDAPIRIGADGRMIFDGKMPQDLQDRLTAAHFNILDKSGPPTTTTEIVSGPKAVEEWRRLGTKYDHQQWYRNDTTGVYDGNELRAYTIKQGDTLVLDMSKMHLGTESGLSPNPIDVQDVIQSREAGFSFKIPGGGHHQSIWIPESADGNADGLLHLDPNDHLHMVTMGDGSKMSIGDLSKMLVNQEELAKYNDGNIATEVYNRRDVFRLGAEGRKGWWEVGRVTNRNGQRVLQTFATGRGTGDAVGINITEVPGKALFEIVPPKSTLVTFTPFESVPIIPLPFAPRWPLEQLVAPATLPINSTYYSSYALPELQRWIREKPTRLKSVRKENGIWVDESGKELKRSVDREREVIKSYLESIKTTNPEHHAYLESLLKDPNMHTMQNETRVSVNIPAWMEGKSIHDVLEQYVRQVDQNGVTLDPKLFEINIIVNRKTGSVPDNSISEIQRFIAESEARGEHYNINFVDVEFDPPLNNVGHARKVLTDLTLIRSMSRSAQSAQLYIESEDADLLHIDPHTIDNIIRSLDTQPHLDAVRGVQDRFPESLMQNDLLFMSRRMWDYSELLLRRGRYRPQNNPHANFQWNRVITGGWNTAYTAEAYALIEGYDSTQTMGEDMGIGEKISMIRGDGTKANLDTIGRVSTRTDSSPRRFITEIISGRGAYSDFTDEAQNAILKNATISELIDRIKPFERINTANVGQFVGTLQGHYQNLIAMCGDVALGREVFDSTMFWLGYKTGDYHFASDGKLKITNWDNIRKALDDYRARHPRPRNPGERTRRHTELPPTPTSTETPPTSGTRPRIPTATTTPVEATTAEAVISGPEAKFVVGKRYVSESGRTYEVTEIKTEPNGKKRILYDVIIGGMVGKGNFSEDRWNEYIDGGRLKPEVVEAAAAIDLGEKTDSSKGAFSTEASPDHPADNQDSVVVDPSRGFIGIFDGAGGHKGGGAASRIAMEQASLALGRLRLGSSRVEVTDAFKAIVAGTYNGHQSHLSSHPEDSSMATTGSILKVFEESGQKHLAILHAGDSRIYAVSKDGSVRQLTQDHSVVYQAVAAGEITAEQGEFLNKALDELKSVPAGTPEEREQNLEWSYFKDRNRLQKGFARGGAPDYSEGVLTDDIKYIVATSDGVHDNLTKSEIEEICKVATTPKQLSDMLVQKAKAISSQIRTNDNVRPKKDDITAAVLVV